MSGIGVALVSYVGTKFCGSS